MSVNAWSGGRIGGTLPLIPPIAGPHDRIKTDRAGAHRACRADVPRHHLGGLGVQLARHKIPARRVAAADAAGRHRRDRCGASGDAGARARAEPPRRARIMAAADAGGAAQRHRLDGADGAGAALAAGQRSRADRLHHAGLGLAAGLAGARRAADAVAHDRAGDGVRRARRDHGRQWHRGECGKAAGNLDGARRARSALRSARCSPRNCRLQLPPIPAAAWQIGLGCFPVAVVGLCIETTHLDHVTQLGWWLLVYST